MRSWHVLVLVAAPLLAGTADAAVKYYSGDVDNGTPGDNFVISGDLSPPVTVTPNSIEGHSRIVDDGLGTVTLSEVNFVQDSLIDVPTERIVTILGPGAFFFSDRRATTFLTAPQVSNTSGIGAFGPSSTAPGAGAEWGVLSTWDITGVAFCASSPATICAQASSVHGQTVPAVLQSNTYDLGTWSFDAVGDMEASRYITVTANGGITNGQFLLRGAFQGASLPALPLAGFGALAAAVLLVGGRALVGRR
jgi:hypothetical protein